MIIILSFKNIKKRMSDYLIFFLTLMFGVSVFYIFSALEKQTNLLLANRKNDTLDAVEISMTMISLFVAMILGGLIVYASTYLIKRRKKEFALYLLFGMKKRKIALIMIYETIMIGTISLFIGILFGIFVSQGMSMFIIKLFDENMQKLKVIVSVRAIKKTIMYFTIMYLIVVLFEVLVVSKTKLINLINSSKKGEYKTNKNPYICVVIFLISMLMLYQAYYVVYSGKWIDFTYVVRVVLGIFFGTMLFFWSFSGLIIFLSKRLKRFYFRGLRYFNSKELASRVNSNTISATLICFMLFCTICMLAVSTNIRKRFNEKLYYNYKDIEFAYNLKDEIIDKHDIKMEDDIYGINDKVNFNIEIDKTKEIFEKYYDEVKDGSIDEVLKNKKVENLFCNGNQIWTYTNGEHILYDYFINSGNEDDESVWPLIFKNMYPEIVKISDYNKYVEGKTNEVKLNDNEFMIMYVSSNETICDRINNLLKDKMPLKIADKTFTPKYDKLLEDDLNIDTKISSFSSDFKLVLPDSVVDTSNFYKYANYMTANYNNKTLIDDKYESMEEYMEDVLVDKECNYFTVTLTKKYRDETYSFTFLILLINIYIGFVFMVTSAGILTLKTLTETNDNVEKYVILRKIGVSEKMINKSIFTQNLIFFGTPLVFSIVHAIAWLKIMQVAFKLGNIVTSDTVTTSSIVIVSLMYSVYFLLTNMTCERIIRERKR